MRMRYFSIFVLFITHAALLAQSSRAVSKPGKIVNPVKEQETPLVDYSPPVQYNNIADEASGMVCTISYRDPSGDQILTQGESGTITVTVKNNTSRTIESPKLELAISTSRTPRPRQTVKWMDPIQAKGNGTYRASITWDERLPAGDVTYSVKVIDMDSGRESSSKAVTFAIGGEDQPLSEEPMFVDVDRGIPQVRRSNPDAVAVIIGNSKYSHKDIPDVEYAVNDANTMKKYLVTMMGFKEENIIFIENATKADLARVFGDENFYQGKLYNWVRANKSDVFIYYAGHGAPDLHEKKAFFMPVNSDPSYVHIDGYSLDVFYKNLNKIPARSMTVVLDACFSGGSQQGMLLRNASPMYIDVDLPFYGDKVTLLTSASGDQVASWYPEGNHSLFTYYFLRALRGEADVNRDRNITLDEIQNYLDTNVTYMARRLYGREQTPTIKGDADYVVARY